MNRREFIQVAGGGLLISGYIRVPTAGSISQFFGDIILLNDQKSLLYKRPVTLQRGRNIFEVIYAPQEPGTVTVATAHIRLFGKFVRSDDVGLVLLGAADKLQIAYNLEIL